MSNVGLKPKNKTETQIIDICTRAHDWLAKELGVESTQVFGRTAYWGRDAFHGGLWINQNKHSVLNFRNLYGENVRNMLEIIGHELRHALQYQKGWLKDNPYANNKSIHAGSWEEGEWMGKDFTGAYRDAPWEIDAKKYQKKYAQMIIDSGVVTAKELDVRLPGERIKYYNEYEKKTQLEEKLNTRIHWFKAADVTREQADKNDKLFDEMLIEAGWVAPKEGSNRWNLPQNASKAKVVKLEKVWDQAKKLYAMRYRRDAIAYLTDAELRACKKDKLDTYWFAQKNILQFDEVELSMSDLTY